MPDASILHPGSHRDPSGFIFEKEGILYRQINAVYKDHYDFFLQSGCYENLVKKGWLIRHEEFSENWNNSADHFIILKPEKIHFVSFPYEWTFDMLKDAALLTLQITREAIAYGMILKDATPYNIQWHQGKMIFIDTLSFEKYNEEDPWIAYRQFCESFLSPLLLMHYSKNSLHSLMVAYPEGIPLAVTRSLLPWKSRFSFHTYLHIHLHASVARKNKTANEKNIKFTKQKLLNLIKSLELLVKKLKLPDQQSTWSEYYEEAAQRKDYLEQKRKILQQWLEGITGIRTAADLGANEGEFAKLLSSRKIPVIAADFDPFCINRLYHKIRSDGETYLQPLVVDLSNPSPAIGVNNMERPSFIDRTSVDLTLALALIHHLVIGKNIPFSLVADFFQQITRILVIEFVPKADEKVQLMLSGRKDIFADYDQVNFESAFKRYFSITRKELIPGSGRTLYLMEKF